MAVEPLRRGVIYKITNKINGIKYIGQSVNFTRRKRQHIAKSHNNYEIDKAINKYGKENFEFEIIEKNILETELDEKEKYWIKKYDTYNNGYNNTKGGQSARGERNYFYDKHYYGEENPFYGKHHTKETKERLSKLQSGENNNLYGKERSKEFKEKMSKIMSSEQHPMLGKKHTKESKQKMSEAHKKHKRKESPVTYKKAKQIIKEYKNKDITYKELEKKYKISFSVIGQIIRGEHWTSEGVV